MNPGGGGLQVRSAFVTTCCVFERRFGKCGNPAGLYRSASVSTFGKTPSLGLIQRTKKRHTSALTDGYYVNSVCSFCGSNTKTWSHHLLHWKNFSLQTSRGSHAPSCLSSRPQEWKTNTPKPTTVVQKCNSRSVRRPQKFPPGTRVE